MDNTLDTLFGPLSKKYCIWFYILSIVGFVFLLLFIVSALFIGITKRKGIEFYLQMLAGAVVYLIFYFQNRLLHSMCTSNV